MMRVTWHTVALCALPLLLMACSAQPSTAVVRTPTATPAPTASPTAGVGAAQCHPPTPLRDIGMGLEAQGAASSGLSLWALVQSSLVAGHMVKIVWRMTGTGAFNVVGLGPGGRNIATDWGPEPHGGSSWNRPGDEWGTGFTFPVAGCWDLHATRADGSGDVYVVVAP